MHALLRPQAVLQAVALTAEDKATFLSRLDSKVRQYAIGPA